METPMGHWHVGSNLPGYLPESDVRCFDDAEQAAIAFREQLRRALDGLPQESEVAGMDAEFLEHEDWLYLHTQSYLAEEIQTCGGLRREVNDGRALPVGYWVEAVDGETAGCDCNEHDDDGLPTEHGSQAALSGQP
jgi:hypothetical protein